MLVRFFADGRFGMLMGILLILVAVYMLIVSISYFAQGAEDQSIVSQNDYATIVEKGEEIGNAGGPLGAFVSHLLLSRWMGLGSFILIFYVGALGVSLVKLKKSRFWPLTFKCLMSAITLSVLTGFLTIGMTSYSYWGGEHGYYVNHLVMTHAGIWGVIGLNILLVAAVVLIFLVEIKMAISAYRRRMQRRREKLERKRALAEARRREAQQRLTPDPIPTQLDNIETHIHPVETVASTPAPGPIAPEPTPAMQSTTVAPGPSTVVNDQSASELDNASSQEEAPLIDATEVKAPEIKPVVEPTPTPSAEQKVEEEAPQPIEQKEVELVLNVAEIEEAPADAQKPDFYDPTAELSHFHGPSIDLLKEYQLKTNNVDIEEQEENKDRITRTLNSYGIEISHIEATVGPTITLYEIIPAEGVRINKIKNLEDDIALSLSALGIRIIAPMPGKGTIGIEVPNRDPQMVPIRNVLSSRKFIESKAALPMAMGFTISNDVYMADLAKLPHLLVAGATGMGKSVGLNTIIASLLYSKHPAELKFVLIDPKMVEFSLYKSLEHHYLAKLPDEEEPIVTDINKAVPTLNSLVAEMEARYLLLKDANVREIKEYNEKFTQRRLNPAHHRYLPYIVVIIDEFADLIMNIGRDVEKPIALIAQKARAVGIHIILATQRPSTNIITGVIKANFPGRIAFRVAQMTDSRTIIDRPGANQLIGKGDMLFLKDGVMERMQCAFISTEEVEAICNEISSEVGYSEAYLLPEYTPPGDGAGGASGNGGAVADTDPLFEDAGRLVIDAQQGSTSHIQRKYNIGYPRAGKIMDQLERAGVVGPTQGSKPRQVLMDSLAFERLIESMQPMQNF